MYNCFIEQLYMYLYIKFKKIFIDDFINLVCKELFYKYNYFLYFLRIYYYIKIN